MGMNTETYGNLPESARAWLQTHGGVELDETLPTGTVEQRHPDGPRVRMSAGSLVHAVAREMPRPSQATLRQRRKRERQNRKAGRR